MQGLIAVGVPKLPFWLLFVRIAIIVLSLAVLIAAAYNVSLYNGLTYGWTTGAAGFLIFDAIFTWIVFGFMLASEYFFPNLYYRIVFLVLIILNAIFWLSGWAWAAQWAGAIGAVYGGHVVDDGLYASIAACAALGAFTWVLVVVVAIFFAISCVKDGGDGVAHTHDSELGHRKPEGASGVAPQQQYTGPPQQQYTGPPPHQEYAQPTAPTQSYNQHAAPLQS